MDRLTRRFLTRSPDGMTDAELLELLLRHAGGNAAEQARQLTEFFPNLAAIFEASPEDLRTVEGIDDEAILLLRLVPELHRRYFLSRAHVERVLLDSASYGAYLLPYFYGARDEMLYLLCLDGAGRVLGCRKLGQGGANSAEVPVRRMVQGALSLNASGVVLAHNHPSGIALPSKEDVELTLRLRDALELMSLTLLDHIVVAEDDFVSMRDSGFLHEF